MQSITVIGSTGLVGSFILTHLLCSPAWPAITTISRRPPAQAPSTENSNSSKLTTIIDSQIDTWPEKIPPQTHTLVSSLGTTRAAAGSLQNQWKIDHDANVALAKAARASGVKTFVFVSAGSTRGPLARMAPYSKMKIGVEDAIKDLEFENAVVLRPGLILGERGEKRTVEGWAQALVRGLGSVSTAAKDMLGQDASVIAMAAVKAAELAADGKAPSSYWVLEAADIVKYGMGKAEEKKEGGK